jgi:hypothetical protein
LISEGYDAFDDPYSYPGTTVLKNLLDLRDSDTLEAFEVEISTLRAEEPVPEGSFDAAHYCAVHRHLFQVLVAVGEGAKMAGPQGPLCHRLMAAETPPVLGVRSAT